MRYVVGTLEIVLSLTGLGVVDYWYINVSKKRWKIISFVQKTQTKLTGPFSIANCNKLREGVVDYIPSLSDQKVQDLTKKVAKFSPRHNLGKHPGIAVERDPCGSDCLNRLAGISWTILNISQVGMLFLFGWCFGT